MGAKFFLRSTLAAVALFSCFLVHAAGDEAGKVILAVGQVQLGTAPAKVGDTVKAGDALSTGADGYVYIKTVDGGFLILRPHSNASVVAYHTDAKDPAKNRIKIELKQGVARSISGEAVKSARQNFRFNTPVAAIGVRGTDFTVFTDQQTTRVAVIQGGVVVSGFGGGCGPEGGGPCEGSTSRELFAGRAGQVLQVMRGQTVPQLVQGGALSPDTSAPPRNDEPGKAGAANGATGGAPTNAANAAGSDPSLAPLKVSGLDKLAPVTAPVVTPPAPAPAPVLSGPAIVWGRWQALVDRPADIDLAKLQADNSLIAINSYFALMRNKEATWHVPAEGGVSFNLQGYQALVKTDGVAGVSMASLENGKLSVDFAKSSFATQFDLLTQGQRIQRQAEGVVGSDGTFSNPSQFLGNNNMVVQGVLTNNPGPQAGYLFQSRLDDKRTASGVTFWGK